MADPLKPRDAAEVEQAIRSALADGKALEVVGHGTKRAIGRAAQWDATLDLSALSGVTLYEPEELVLSARAGTPLAEIEALVAASKQELAFEPMDYGPLLGTPPGAGTIGGVLAANLSGPRRIKAGAARDHFLGFTAVSGRGETFKSGGRVVKNVTGYDLCKLIAGSWGTLAAMTDVTIKTLPRAETEATVLVLKLDDATARKAMAAAMGSFADVSAAAHLPAIAAARIAEIAAAQTAVTAFRLEGVAPSVARAQDRAGEALGAVRLAWCARRSGIAGAVARGPRRDAVRGGRTGGHARPLAHLDGADARRRRRPRARGKGRRRASLRLGWRARLGGVAGRERRARAAGARHCRGRRRPCHADPRAGRGARRGRRLHAGSAGACRVDGAGAGRVSIRKACSMPGACGRACSHADHFHARAACRSRHRRIGKNPARLRALRLLHRDLPDLCARRQRARFAARAHLPDQGHAGARPAGDGGRRRAHRPLPVVPCLHDDLSVGRALHASGRPCPRPYRKHLSPAAGRASVAHDAGQADALSAALPAGAPCGAPGKAVGAAPRGARA